MRQNRANRGRRRSRHQIPGPSSNLSSLSKKELVALVLQLQARGEQQCKPGNADGDPFQPGGPQPTSVADAPRLVIDGSIRSGQVVEFPAGDVTVIGSVGSGAEIIAGGSIHIYGALRGRAVAGSAGDRTARIFCRSFQAELLAIDGRYRLAENISPALRGRAVQARLEEMGMTVSPIDGL